jgi:hypothetical protein
LSTAGRDFLEAIADELLQSQWHFRVEDDWSDRRSMMIASRITADVFPANG